jgi:hypothetical protein
VNCATFDLLRHLHAAYTTQTTAKTRRTNPVAALDNTAVKSALLSSNDTVSFCDSAKPPLAHEPLPDDREALPGCAQVDKGADGETVAASRDGMRCGDDNETDADCVIVAICGAECVPTRFIRRCEIVGVACATELDAVRRPRSVSATEGEFETVCVCVGEVVPFEGTLDELVWLADRALEVDALCDFEHVCDAVNVLEGFWVALGVWICVLVTLSDRDGVMLRLCELVML